MSQLISVHSFRRGVGKSMAAANIATLLAVSGQRVGVVDTSFQSPSVNLLFGLADDIAPTLNDYLEGRFSIRETAYDVTAALDENLRGQVWVVPCNTFAGKLAESLPEGQYTTLLNDGCRKLVKDLSLDTMVLDTDSGLNGDTLPGIAMSDTVLLVLGHDQRDYQGTSVTVDVLNRLAAVPRIVLMINEVPTIFDFADVKAQVAETYHTEVAGGLPHF